MLLFELTNKWPLLREYQLSCYLHLNSEYISSLIILVVIHSMYSCNYYTDSLKIMNFNKICYRHWWSQRKSMCQYVECRWLLQLKKNNILSPPVGNQLLNCLVIDTIINILTPGKTYIARCDQGIIDPTRKETWQKFFSYVCNRNFFSKLFTPTFNGITASVRCVSSILVILNARLPC